MRNEVIAIVCADLHLSHKAPVFRSAEPDWYAAMRRPLTALRELAKEFEVPVICAGDIFHHWRSPPELINFAIDELPKGMYAIPGQHDMPYHDISLMNQSAYRVLMAAGTIQNIPLNPLHISTGKSTGICLYGFPWSVPVEDLSSKLPNTIHLAVVHSYIWSGGKRYPGAPKEKHVGTYFKALKNYDAAVFGDNHIPFTVSMENDSGDRRILFNCGTFMRRKSDETADPRIGFLTSDGTILPHLLDTSEDKYAEVTEALELAERAFDASGFVDQLANLCQGAMDFASTLNRFLDENDNVDGDVRRIILETLEKAAKG